MQTTEAVRRLARINAKTAELQRSLVEEGGEVPPAKAEERKSLWRQIVAEVVDFQNIVLAEGNAKAAASVAQGRTN